MLVGAFSLQAQLNYDYWETVNITDDFGDPTGETARVIFCNGNFSNSATSNNDDFIAKFVDYSSGGMVIQLFEYSKAPSASITYKTSQGLIRVKINSGDVMSYDNIYGLENGGLYIEKDNDFLEMVRSSNYLKININQSDFSDYGNSVYNIIYNVK
jgi:hypothetical protein